MCILVKEDAVVKDVKERLTCPHLGTLSTERLTCPLPRNTELVTLLIPGTYASRSLPLA